MTRPAISDDKSAILDDEPAVDLDADLSTGAVEVQLADTEIRAPFSGIITQRYADPGAFVTPTTSASATASAAGTIPQPG